MQTIPIIFLRVPTSSILNDLRFDYRMERVDSEVSLKEWWKVNSSGRAREKIFDSPLWPFIRIKYLEKCNYFVCYDGVVPVGCIALESFNDQFNIWGTATCPSYQRKGVSKFLTNSLITGKYLTAEYFYAQCNYQAPWFYYLTGVEGAIEEKREVRYEITT